MTVQALVGLDDESLLKVGQDLANFCALAIQNDQDSIASVKTILGRVGRLDNDLVVLVLRDSGDLLVECPTLFKELVFDLVKFYFKPQAAVVGPILTSMFKKAVSGSVASCRAISEVIT